ncbi:MAG: hypothetical protein EA367_14455 [Leptolyngbya sp. DLM2.Bin15]|nr:MAG: hypothetical protein EA367_14455 [Leptolyngbya sp. DLM2.Bin15]
MSAHANPDYDWDQPKLQLTIPAGLRDWIHRWPIMAMGLLNYLPSFLLSILIVHLAFTEVSPGDRPAVPQPDVGIVQPARPHSHPKAIALDLSQPRLTPLPSAASVSPGNRESAGTDVGEIVAKTLRLFSRPEAVPPEPEPRSPQPSQQDLYPSGLYAWISGEPWEGDRLFQGGPDSIIAKAIGAAEGTRTVTGDRTPAYYGHRDPGNGVWNLGTFSYQHGAQSPEEADQRQLARLYRQTQLLRSLAGRRNLDLTQEVIINGIDLANQAPLAALSDEGGYVDRLQEAYRRGHRGADAVLEARVYSYLNPSTNRWDAPGLGNTYQGIKADQLRRQQAIARVLDHSGIIAHQPIANPEPAHTPLPQAIEPLPVERSPAPIPAYDIAAVPPAERSPHPDLDQQGVLSFGLL